MGAGASQALPLQKELFMKIRAAFYSLTTATQSQYFQMKSCTHSDQTEHGSQNHGSQASAQSRSHLSCEASAL